MSMTNHSEIQTLLDLSARIGADPMLTQASTGNTSVKLGGILWIKASGKWLADAKHEEFLIPVDLAEAREWMRKNIDPADMFVGETGKRRASLETAMHAALPHRVVIHVHSINTIAWAVREDAPERLRQRLDGLQWGWIPYVSSGLPLAREIERVRAVSPGVNVIVLGNHGLVIGADDCTAAEALLKDVERRMATMPRRVPDADYAVLEKIAASSGLSLPGAVDLHALGADADARKIISGGLLYPCQSIFSESVFSESKTRELFRPMPCPDERDRPFVIIEGAGIVIDPTMSPASYAMLCGLARVVQRIDGCAPVRYLTDADLGGGFDASAYRERAEADHRSVLSS
jgi:rhamnose utilization protein RhaD (predicted bifunctional aldolase and dehydrogenase)